MWSMNRVGVSDQAEVCTVQSVACGDAGSGVAGGWGRWDFVRDLNSRENVLNLKNASLNATCRQLNQCTASYHGTG